MQIEADHCCRCVGSDVELVDLYGEHSEQIAVRMIAMGRAWAAITWRTEIGTGLQRSFRQYATRTSWYAAPVVVAYLAITDP